MTFLYKKPPRAVGWYKALFLIDIFGFVGLAPFALSSTTLLPKGMYLPLAGLSIIIFLYAWALFEETLHIGKISIVESVVVIELSFTVSLGIFIGGESLTPFRGMLFLLVCVGIVLAAAKEFNHFKRGKHWFEKSVLLAFFGSFPSALTNFL